MHHYSRVSWKIVLLSLLGLLLAGQLSGLNLPNSAVSEQASNGYATPQSSNKKITLADGTCVKVTSTTNQQYFIPTKDATQYQSFESHLPSGVSTGVCINIQDSVGQHCDIGGDWGWRDARDGGLDNNQPPYLFGSPGFEGPIVVTYGQYTYNEASNEYIPSATGDYCLDTTTPRYNYDEVSSMYTASPGGAYCRNPDTGEYYSCSPYYMCSTPAHRDPTKNYDNRLCVTGKHAVVAGKNGLSCPPGSTAYGDGCYFPNTSPDKPASCAGADPGDECCFFICQ